MSLEMIYREKWLVRTDGQPLGGGTSDKKRASQARSGGGREGVELLYCDLRFGERLLEQTGQVNEMIARREFWHHAAELLMRLNLRSHFVCQ